MDPNNCDNLYILNDSGEVVKEPNIMKWAKWFEAKNQRRIVARTKVGDSEVSTVFLGVDHKFHYKGPPILWETMVFGGKLDQDLDRCSGTREQAEAMHGRMVKKVQAQLLVAE